MIKNYNDFLKALLNAGFSMAGGNDEGIYAVIYWGWNEAPPYNTPVVWHGGDPELDPWEWRMRVLDERDDTAYAKVFFKKGGFITKDWYPYFLAARRGIGGVSDNTTGIITFEEAYMGGKISHAAKRIYDEVVAAGVLPLETIKQAAGFGKEDKSAFDRALTELQMHMFLTICGRRQKTHNGAWSSTVLCTTETFWTATDGTNEVFAKAAKIAKEEAAMKIKEQVLTLNPDAADKKAVKFILG